MYLYRTYGLTLASMLELPELPQFTAKVVDADIVIRYGEAPAQLDNPTGEGVCYQLDAQRCLLNLEMLVGVRYLIQNGKEIIVEQKPCAKAADVRLFLLGSCMAVLLYQRNTLPMHGSAIQTPLGSVLFVGVSGSGKSTLAAAFGQRGYRFIADDISVVHFDATGFPSIQPGYPQVRLWKDAIAALGQTVALENAVRIELEKYALPVKCLLPAPDEGDAGMEQGISLAEVARVAAIYILQPHNAPTLQLEQIHGMAKMLPLQVHAYRDRFALEMGKQSWLFAQIAALAQQVAVSRVRRPKQGFRLAELVDLIEQDLGLARKAAQPENASNRPSFAALLSAHPEIQYG